VRRGNEFWSCSIPLSEPENLALQNKVGGRGSRCATALHTLEQQNYLTPKPVNARPYTIARGALRRLVPQQRAEPGSTGGKDSPAANGGAKLSLRTKTQGEVETQSRFHNFHGDRIAHGGEGHPVYGVTNQKGGFALLSQDGRAEHMKTMPHEIGRYFGTLGKGSLYDDNNSSEELLMCQGEGDSTKVLRLSRNSWPEIVAGLSTVGIRMNPWAIRRFFNPSKTRSDISTQIISD
jgi:hypothetical protein